LRERGDHGDDAQIESLDDTGMATTTAAELI
jgi:hypothetical protein